jgi:SAM-dependent methyltransferase
MNVVPEEFNPSLTHPNYLIRKQLFTYIKELAPNLKGKMMDFGCGQKPYKSLFTAQEYIGVDFENPGHPHINESIDEFYDGHTLPFPDQHFDSVFSSEVFEHIFNLPEILKELNRVLKVNGLILVTCPFTYCEHEVPNDFARYSSFAMTHLFNSNGFEVVQQIKTGNSTQAIFQLLITYMHLHIMPVFRKIPVIRSIFRVFVYGLLNITALLFSKIFPPGKELYLNNVFLCRKISHLPV